jgi:hypothetical protein
MHADSYLFPLARKPYAAAGCFAGPDAAGFAVLLLVTLLRPSTLTGTSPRTVERRTTRFWSPYDGVAAGRSEAFMMPSPKLLAA